MQISVIIPTFNEAENIARLVAWLRGHSQGGLQEIIVSDGGSQDETAELARQAGATVLVAPRKGRAAQMNFAAKTALGEVLYFVHADVLPPPGFVQDVQAAIASEHPTGCFTYRYDSNLLLLKIHALWNKLNWLGTGGGDQTLFVERWVFEQLGGFKDHLRIMEDFDFVWRAKQRFPFKLIKNEAVVSARKFGQNDFFLVFWVNILVVVLFRLGVSQELICRFYRRLVKVR